MLATTSHPRGLERTTGLVCVSIPKDTRILSLENSVARAIAPYPLALEQETGFEPA